LIKKVQLIS